MDFIRKQNVLLRPVKQQKEFLLDGERAGSNFLQYNSLKDKHLQNHFSNKKLRKLLCNNGLVKIEKIVNKENRLQKMVVLLKKSQALINLKRLKHLKKTKKKDLSINPLM